MKKTLAVAFVALAGLTLRADTITYTNSFASTLTDWSTTLNLPKFDASLGTLNSIDITLTSGISSVLFITNNVDSPSFGDESSLLQLYVAKPGTYDIFGTHGTPVFSKTTPDFNYSLDGTIGWGTNSDALTTSGFKDSGAITDSATLTLFTGTGTQGLSVNTATFITGYHTGNQTQINVTTADLKSVITYDFTAAPVPEPTTFAMIGAGLASLGMVWRRRSSK